MLTVTIKEGKEKLLKKHHPWVFSGAIQNIDGEGPGFAKVLSYDGGFIAYGYYDEKSHIILHLLSWRMDDIMGEEFIKALVRKSVLRRKDLLSLKGTTCLRLIHGEADFLPGIAADCYGREIRVIISSRFASAFLAVIAAELDALLHPAVIEAVVDKAFASSEGLSERVRTFKDGKETEEFRKWLEKGIRTIRTRSKAPILLVTHDCMGCRNSRTGAKNLRQAGREVQAVCEAMRKETENLFCLTVQKPEASTNRISATDQSMEQCADICYQKIAELLFPELGSLSFTPCRQHRDSYTYRWTDRHEEILKYNAKVKPEIVMLGNSITHFWGGLPFEKRRVADDIWQKLFKGRRTVNLGYGWDRIENIQWRILHGELDGYHAQKSS